MKKYTYLLIVLLSMAALTTLVSADEKKDKSTKYEVTVEMRFNSVTFDRAQEIERIIKEIAAESCKTEIKKEKLPKDDDQAIWSATTGITFTPDN